MRSMLFVALLFLLAASSGCETPWTTDPKRILAAPDLVMPLTGTVIASEMLSLTERSGKMLFTAGSEAGSKASFKLEKSGDRWRLVVKDFQSTTYQRGADGAILIEEEEDFDNDVRVVYTPAIVALPAKMEPAKPYDGRCKMVVRDRDDDTVKTQGDCRYTVSVIGSQRLRTPAGTFESWLVKTTRHMTLSLATSDVTVITAYHRQHGIVAEQTHETTRALGLFPIQDNREIRLAK